MTIHSTVRRGASRRHAANRLFLEITLVMLFLILLSYAPTTSPQTSFTETVIAADKTSLGQAAAGRELWLRLSASGSLNIKHATDKDTQGWSAIHAYIEKQAIGVVVIDPDKDVPFSLLASAWKLAAQSGLIVRIATKK